jgi:HAAS
VTDGYRRRLLAGLRGSARERRRIVAELEDHWACAVADLRAAGVGALEAEQLATERLGRPEELAAAFARQQAAVAARRAVHGCAALAVVLVIGFAPFGRWLPGAGARFPGSVAALVLWQVALVVAALTVLRSSRAPSTAESSWLAWRVMLRGVVVEVGCGAGALVVALAGLVRSTSAVVSLRDWVAVGALTATLAATTVLLARAWQFTFARIPGVGGPVDSDAVRGWLADASFLEGCAGPATSRSGDVVEDLAAVGKNVLIQMRGSDLVVARLITAAQRLAVRVSQRAPWLAGWLSLRAHPWRFALLVSVCAGLGLAAAHALAEGVSGAHVLGALAAAGLITSVEALASLLGFLVLGRFLAIRPGRRREVVSGE